MADFDPEAFVAKAQPAPSEAFDPAAFVAKASPAPAAPPGDPSQGHFAEEFNDFSDWLRPKVRAAINGATFRHAADIAGFMDPANKAAYQREYHNASEDNVVPEILGGLAAPIPGTGKLKAIKGAGGLLLRLLAHAGIGAGTGVATGDTGMSTGERALYGGVAGLLGGGTAEGLEGLASKAAQKIRLATADQAAIITKGTQKAVRQATSAVGGETSAIMHNLEVTQRVASGNGPYTPEQVAAARARLEDPRFQEVVRNAAAAALGLGADRMEGSFKTAQAARESAMAANTPEAIEAATDEALAHPFKRQLFPRVAHYAQRAIPVAAGTAVGGPAGAVVGGVTAASLGHSGTAFSNMMKSPAFRKGIWELVQGAALPASSALKRVVPSTIEGIEGPATMPMADDDEMQRQRALAEALRRTP